MNRPSAILLMFAASVVACTATTESEQRAESLATSIQEQQIEHFIRTFSLAAPTRAVARAERDAGTPSIAAMIEEGRLDFETDPAVRELVTLLFAERGYEHLFVYGSRLTPDGQAVVDAVRSADSEGLDPAELHAEAIRDRVDTLARAGDVGDLLDDLQLSLEDEGVLLAFMMGHSGIDGTLPASDALFETIARAGEDNPLPRYAGAIATLTGRLGDAAQAGPELELVLASAFIRYSIANRHSNLGYVREDFAAEHGWGDVEDQRDEAERALAGASFRRALESGFASEIAKLRPPFETYDALVSALADYERYIDAGGWAPIDTERSLRNGRTSDAVVSLRRRLAAEEYFSGDLESRHFDDELEEAVRWYQRTHQLEIDGEVAGGTLRSLNIPAERRAAQIRVALDKWRDSVLAADWEREYIWVNVPEFFAELRDGEELVYRWRVVVGRERSALDAQGNPRGRTPLFSDLMEYIVFNPYWNVPLQIQREEYDPLIAADPNWLKVNGFELAVEGDREWLRQLPGPGNALGMVKFLFPNSHDVYMHDTPSRDLFQRAVRNYSHGCVRVEDPLVLARILLERDRDWSHHRAQRYIDEMLDEGTEQWVSLRNPIPVHIEYITVSIDNDGRPNFLADPYGYDRALVDAVQARVYPSEPEGSAD